MSKWTYVKNQEDIDEFMNLTMGLHDAYIVGMEYMARTFLGDVGTYFGEPTHKRLRLIFDSE